MKKAMFVMAIVFAFVAGIFATTLDWESITDSDWEFDRGVGATEVRADYDRTNFDGRVYYEVLLWDKEYVNYEIVESGVCEKDALVAMSEYAHDREPVYLASVKF